VPALDSGGVDRGDVCPPAKKLSYPTTILLLVLYPMSDSKRQTRERSLSGDFDSDFEELHPLDDSPAGKPGRKKNPNSQAARRDQNRIAQREFRLRKQQRVIISSSLLFSQTAD